jgi:sporulation protein YqfC
MKKKQPCQAVRGRSACGRALAAALPRLTLECIEKYELLVCGCRKIELYSPEKTVICAHSGKVSVCGAELTISFLGDGKVKLSGVIDAIEFI